MLIGTYGDMSHSCDGDLCMEIGPSGGNQDEATRKAIEAGWREFGGNIFCPACCQGEVGLCPDVVPDHVVDSMNYQI